MNNMPPIARLLIVIIFAIVVTTVLLTPLVLHPWHIIPQLGADGGKNAFVYLYQALYGNGFWFEGMNYPYGEHIVYTDGQPILSVPLSYLKGVSMAQVLTVMWRLIMFSYIIAIIYVYKILIHFKISPFFAMLFAGLIIMLNPQIFRIQGHYGLSYVCIIPMLYYWTVMYNHSPHFKYAIYIFMLGCIMGFLHPYYAAISLVWVVFYSIAFLIVSKCAFKKRILHIYPLLLSVISVFVVISVIMKITDPVTDRPVAPYGFVSYCVTGSQILTSYYSPLWKYVKDNTSFKDVCDGAEGFCYIGITTIIIIILSCVMGILNKRKKIGSLYFGSDNTYSSLWLIMALLILLLSMGVPFVWNMEWLLDYAVFFRKFRTPGRFIWIFYYIITVYGVVVLFSWYTKCVINNRKVLANAIIFSVICLWCFEIKGYVAYEHDSLGKSYPNYDILHSTNGNNWTDFLKEKNRNAGDFQAILVLRFFDIGTEKLWIGNDTYERGIAYGAEAGIQLHLPIVDASRSRSSWSVAEKQVKISAGPYVHKPMLYDLKSNKPFLLLHVGPDALDPDESYLLSCADLIGNFHNCNVYACYPERIKISDKRYMDSIKTMASLLKTGDSCLRHRGEWYVNHFDAITAKEKFYGNGAQVRITKQDTNLATIPLTPLFDNQLYEFSCWFLLSDKNYRSPNFKIEILDATGNVTKVVEVFTKQSRDNMGLWFRASAYFEIPGNCRSIRFRLTSDNEGDYKLMDEMMLRPADAVIVSKSVDGGIMANNHLIQL